MRFSIVTETGQINKYIFFLLNFYFLMIPDAEGRALYETF